MKRSYKLWTEKSKHEFDKVFKDYVKADYGYPSKCELLLVDAAKQKDTN